MRKNATKNDVLVGLGELEKLAGRYEATAKVLRKLARGLRSVTNGFGEAQVPLKATNAKKVPLRTNAGHPKRKPMSAAVKKRLSEAMRKRWAERKADQKPKLARRTGDEASGNGQKGQVA